MSPILLRCGGLRFLKLLAIAALLAGLWMLADQRVAAQGGPGGAAKDGDQSATPAADGKQGEKPEAEADEPEEPATPSEEPAGIVDTGSYRKPTLDLTQKIQEVQIGRIAMKGTFEGDEQAVFDKYFQSYFFPSWADPSFIAKVQDQRGKLRTFFKQSRSGQVHDELLALSMRFLKILADTSGPPFHPATRYNAMLAIGELNDSEPSSSSLAVPHADALPVLLESLKKGPSDALRVAALRGLLRHCTSGIANAQVRDAEVIPALLELAKSRPPKDRSPEGHAWMRALAIESLAALHVSGVAGAGAVGPNGVLDAIVVILGDPASPLPVRCAAARALSSINPAPQFSTTPDQMAALLRQLTAAFCEAELDREKKFPDTLVFRREVRERLNDVKKALDARGAAGDAAGADLAEEVRSLIAKLDVKDAKDEAMAADIKKTLDKLRVQTPATSAAATPRAEAAVP